MGDTSPAIFLRYILEAINTLQRYDVTTDGHCADEYCEMSGTLEPAEDGEVVKYADLVAAIKAFAEPEEATNGEG